MAHIWCSQKLRESIDHGKQLCADPWKDKKQDEDAANKDILLDEVISRIGFGKFQIKLLLIVSLIWVADALEMMMISFISPALACDFNLADSSIAALTTMIFIGMFFGAFAWGIFDDRYGRKKGYFASVLWTFCFGILCPFAPTYPILCFLRMLVGFGVAGSHVAITIFSEFLPSSKRALFIILIAAFWSIGSIFEALLAWIVMPNVPKSVAVNGVEINGLNWRVLMGLSSLPLLIIMALWNHLPESPRFDLLHGNLESLQKTLQKVAKDNGKPMPKGNIVVVKHPKFTLLDQLKMLFMPAKMMCMTLLTWTIWFGCSLTYYGIVLLNTELLLLEAEGEHCREIYYHEPSAIDGANFTNVTNVTNSECQQLESHHFADAFLDSVAELPGVFVTFFLLEFVGRKLTIASELFALGLMFFILCFCMYRGAQTLVLFLGRGLVAGAFQATYVFTSEAYPTVVRAIAMGSSSSFARLGGMVTPFVSQVLIHFDPTPFWANGLFIVFCIAAGVASIMLPVETRGKDLADVVTPQDTDDANDVASSIELADRVGNSVLLRRESAHNDEHFDEGPRMDDADEVML